MSLASHRVAPLHIASQALTFADPKDYDKIAPTDKVSIKGLASFAPGVPLTLEGTRADGSTYSFPLNHTFNEGQISWFRAGSALNALVSSRSDINVERLGEINVAALFARFLGLTTFESSLHAYNSS